MNEPSENSRRIRGDVCQNMEWAGMSLDATRNEQASGECRISSDASNVEIWVVPTNEEIIVARQTVSVLEQSSDRQQTLHQDFVWGGTPYCVTTAASSFSRSSRAQSDGR